MHIKNQFGFRAEKETKETLVALKMFLEQKLDKKDNTIFAFMHRHWHGKLGVSVCMQTIRDWLERQNIKMKVL